MLSHTNVEFSVAQCSNIEFRVSILRSNVACHDIRISNAVWLNIRMSNARPTSRSFTGCILVNKWWKFHSHGQRRLWSAEIRRLNCVFVRSTCKQVRFLTFRPNLLYMHLLHRSDPAGTQHQNDVVSTSMRRDHVASTLIRRHFNVVCPLGTISYNNRRGSQVWVLYLFLDQNKTPSVLVTDFTHSETLRASLIKITNGNFPLF